MALQAFLILDNDPSPYSVRELNYDLERRISSNGKPTSTPKGGIIHCTILSQGPDKLKFHEWIMGTAKDKRTPLQLGGKFILPVTDGPKKFMRKLAFSEAYLVRLSESYSAYSASQMQMHLTISAQTMKFSEANTQTDFVNDEID